MTSELSAEILPTALAQIVDSVFGTMLSMDAAVGETQWYPSGDRMTAAVHLTGDWTGALLLECDKSQACLFAGRFLSTDPPSAVDDDVRDVLGELANMIGGNLKCVLTPGIRLSVPSVVDGGDYSMRICGARIRTRIPFHCGDGPFWVTVLSVEGNDIRSPRTD
jgi:chemotaxis protein CheX